MESPEGPREERDQTSNDTDRLIARRRLLAALAASGAFVALPNNWLEPLTSFGVLPAHASTSAVDGGLDASADGATRDSAADGPSGSDADVPDSAQPDGDITDAGPQDSQPDAFDAGTPICTVTVGLSVKDYLPGRDIYLVRMTFETDPDAGCPLEPVVGPRTGEEPVTIGFLSGSPGYSIDARPDYVLSNVVGATLRVTDVGPPGQAIDALEGNIVSFDVQQRSFDPDGGFGPGTGPLHHFRIRMNPDPVPANWSVSLYEYKVT